METVTTEQVETEEEQEDTTSEAKTEEETEVSEESEEEGTEEAPKLDEEAKQKVIKEEYAKWQSKTLNPIAKERDDLRKQVADFKSQLEDKNDNKELDLLLKADIEDLGEEEAKKLDAVRRKYTTTLREYRDNKIKVDKAIKDNESTAEKLGGIQRHQMATEKAYELLIPEDKKFRKQLTTIVEELEQAESPEHMERLLKVIIRERSGNKKPFEPDSSRNSGSGIDYSKLTPSELLEVGFRELKSKK